MCVAYEVDGERHDELPTNQAEFARAVPIYETFPGWNEDISEARTLDDLPRNARDYVDALEKMIKAPISAIGVGPGPRRDDRRPRPARLTAVRGSTRCGCVCAHARRRDAARSSCRGLHVPSRPAAVRGPRRRPRRRPTHDDTVGRAAATTAARLADVPRRPRPHRLRDEHAEPTAATLHVVPDAQARRRVYASPIVGGGLTIVATENDTVYAFNAGEQAGVEAASRHAVAGQRTAVRQHRPARHHRHAGLRRGDHRVRRGRVRRTAAARLVALDVRTGTVALRTSARPARRRPPAMQERGALPSPADGSGCRSADWPAIAASTRAASSASRSTAAARRSPTPCPRRARPASGRRPGRRRRRGNFFVAVGNGASGAGDALRLQRLGPEAEHVARSCSTRSRRRRWPTDNDADLDLGSQGPTLVGRWIFSAASPARPTCCSRANLGGIGGQVSRRTCAGRSAARRWRQTSSTCRAPTACAPSTSTPPGRCTCCGSAPSSITGSPVVGGGRVWTLDPNGGVLHALDPPTGTSRASIRWARSAAFATPALSGTTSRATLTGLTVVRTS